MTSVLMEIRCRKKINDFFTSNLGKVSARLIWTLVQNNISMFYFSPKFLRVANISSADLRFSNVIRKKQQSIRVSMMIKIKARCKWRPSFGEAVFLRIWNSSPINSFKTEVVII